MLQRQWYSVPGRVVMSDPVFASSPPARSCPRGRIAHTQVGERQMSNRCSALSLALQALNGRPQSEKLDVIQSTECLQTSKYSPLQLTLSSTAIEFNDVPT
ncbi:hypothetical protein J6590_025269 [Homalodisca vitripennis]|nr:hypothetical protein J6590_025269 [Homalodisca vitripennis]